MDENLILEKSNEFPYSIYKGEREHTYIVCFIDGQGKEYKTEIKEEIYQYLIKSYKTLKSQRNKFDRHIEHSEIYEDNLVKRAKEKTISMEDEFVQKATFDALKKAIDMLEEPYKKRIKLYYFDDKNETEIAEIEGVSQQAISKTLHIALEKLKEFLKNFQN